jgi:hypothetical protein
LGIFVGGQFLFVTLHIISHASGVVRAVENGLCLAVDLHTTMSKCPADIKFNNSINLKEMCNKAYMPLLGYV